MRRTKASGSGLGDGRTIGMARRGSLRSLLLVQLLHSIAFMDPVSGLGIKPHILAIAAQAWPQFGQRCKPFPLLPMCFQAGRHVRA